MHQTKEKSETQTKIEYQWSVNDRVPDAEFTLSAFGLPEPGGEPPVAKSVPPYVCVLAMAGVCALLAFGFRHLLRRTRPVTAP